MSAYDPEEKYRQLHPKSHQIWMDTSKYLPGGVSAYGQYKKPFPLYFVKAKGQDYGTLTGSSTSTPTAVTVQ